jgi:hypothetical protein
VRKIREMGKVGRQEPGGRRIAVWLLAAEFWLLFSSVIIIALVE